MFPSKNVVDYGSEANWFLPTNRMDGDTSNTYNSPFQTPIANRYSSSTDSTSPESYFNTPLQINQHFEHSRTRSDTPKTYDSKLHDSRPIFYNNFDSPPIYDSRPLKFDTSLFDRTVPGVTPRHYNSLSTIPYDSNIPVHQHQSNDYNQIHDTPFQLQRHRAIVGRKILGCHSRLSGNEELKTDTDYSIWQPKTPEPTQMPYELFPSNEKCSGFHTPVKKTADYPANSRYKISPTSSVVPVSYLSQSVSPASSTIRYTDNLSPSTTNRLQYTDNLSPTTSKRLQFIENQPPTGLNINRYSENMSPTPNRLCYTKNLSPTTSRICYPENLSPTSKKILYPQFKPPYNPSHTGASSSNGEIGPSKMCMFCRKNGETASVYMDHCVKEKIGNKYKVTCPILRELVCMTCGATGDDAHTITYCPVLRSCNNGKPLQSTTITLKSTRIKSDGTKRNKTNTNQYLWQG
ncbi:uncharacterized protein LOC120634721 [Pararge aegeria]|uniref:uncharacterized protein LOC120634721 n=1 Tax=Pararge aegeria TaxID=116150 RepID=UPI0019D2F27F|nr:uncharacterized protein LOC120634721 [Pararge aegeria]